jgi:ABC-type Fe2+-enterobactin transport system substrate-binding protein
MVVKWTFPKITNSKKPNTVKKKPKHIIPTTTDITNMYILSQINSPKNSIF